MNLHQDDGKKTKAKITKKQKAAPDGLVWSLHVDGASNAHGSGAGIIFVKPDGEKLRYALHFQFKTSNNEAEYEALIEG